MRAEGFVNRRRYLRFNSESKINFQVQKKGRNQTLSEKTSAITRNLSIEGICFICEKNLTPGDIIKLEIVLPSQSQPLHLEGQVQWVGSLKPTENIEVFEAGVKLFTFKEEEDENRFIEYTRGKMSGRLN